MKTNKQINMVKNSVKLEAGCLSNDAFDLLLSLTGIRSENLIDALRDYYVTGMTKSGAYKKHGVDKTIFSRKLPVIQKTFEKVISFSNAYGLN